MDLKKLFENSVLTEETQQVIQEAFDSAIKVKEVEMEAALQEEKAELLTSMTQLVEEAVSEEMKAIADEIKHARTLEVQYAEKLQTFKESYAEKQDEIMRSLVAESVKEELDELKEDIELAKKHQFVMDVFESFKTVYEKMFGTTDITVFDELEESKKELDILRREKKLNKLLEGLTGNKREIAETILESVPYDRLDSRFESIQTVLLSESVAPKEEKSETPTGTIVMEDVETVVEVEVKAPVEDDRLNRRLQESLKWIKR
jgi:hypothetical protein